MSGLLFASAGEDEIAGLGLQVFTDGGMILGEGLLLTLGIEQQAIVAYISAKCNFFSKGSNMEWLQRK